MNDEDVPVGFFVLFNDVTLAGIGTIASRIDGHHVDARLTLDDPLRELPAGAAGRSNAEAVALVEPEIPSAPGGTDQWAAIRRVGDRTIDDVLDAAIGERGNAALCGLDVRQQPLQIALEQALAEPIGDAVGEPRGGTGLVGTQDPAQPLFTQVVRLVRLTQHREFTPALLAVSLQFGRFVVHDVLVLDGNRRDVQTEEATGLARVVPRRADHVLGDDIAFVGRQVPFAGRRAFDGGNLGVFMNFGTACARTFAQRHGQVGGRNMAVVRVI